MLSKAKALRLKAQTRAVFAKFLQSNAQYQSFSDTAAGIKPSGGFFIETLLAYFELEDPNEGQVDEVLVNGCRSLTKVYTSKNELVSSPFSSHVQLLDSIQEFASKQGVRLDPLNPSAGGFFAPLQNEKVEYRWHAVIPPVAQDEPLFSLRRHRFRQLGLGDFGLDEATIVELRRIAASSNESLIVAGPTGAGKSTLLSALLKESLFEKRLLFLESVSELPLLSPRWIRLTERAADVEGSGAFSLPWLFGEALRMRPDRIVVGELRRGEVASFMQAIYSGHGGIFATIHAGSAEDARIRFNQLAQRGDHRDYRYEAIKINCLILRRPDSAGKNRFVSLESLLIGP